VVWCVTVHNGESVRVAWADWTALTSDAGGRDGWHLESRFGIWAFAFAFDT
jgi:hypothetical protein